MKTRVVAGGILIIVGVICLVFQGITYTRHKKVLQVGSFEATTEQRKTIPLPPVVGGIALLAGVALLMTSRKAV